MDQAHPESSRSASADRPRRYSDDFKLDAVRLITEEQYKFKTAARAVAASSSYAPRTALVTSFCCFASR